MKRTFNMFLCLATLLSLVACSSKAKINCNNCKNPISAIANFCEHCGTSVQANVGSYTSETTATIEKSVDSENLLDSLQGHWACVIDGTCYGISFTQDQFTLWSYPGEYEPTGTITSIKQDNDEIEITVHYPETEHMGEMLFEHDEQHCISSRDNYESTLVSNETEFIFLGTTEQEIWEKCDALIANENSN